MKRLILAFLISPLVVPLLILAGGIRPNMVRFAFAAVPISYGLTALVGILVYLAREVGRGRPQLWASLVIGALVGAGFLFSWTGDALDRPTIGVYLVYAGLGVATAAIGHLIAFGLKRDSASEEEPNQTPEPTAPSGRGSS